MVSTILGVLTALAIAGWGIYWYLEQRERQKGRRKRRYLSQRVRSGGLIGRGSEKLLLREEDMLPLRTMEQESESGAEEAIQQEGAGRFAPVPGSTEDAEIDPPATPGSGTSMVQEAIQSLPEPPEEAEALSPTEARSAEREPVTDDHHEFIGYCARCRERRSLQDEKFIRTRQGKPAIRGVCSVCGAGMFVFTSEEIWETNVVTDSNLREEEEAR